MADEMFDDKVIPWIASSKSSDQKWRSDTKSQPCMISSSTNF